MRTQDVASDFPTERPPEKRPGDGIKRPPQNETAGALAGAAGGDEKTSKVIAATPYQNRRRCATAKPAERVDHALVEATDADDRPPGLFNDLWLAERAIFAARRAAGVAL